MTPYTGPSQLVKALAVAQKVDFLAAFGFFVASPLPEHARSPPLKQFCVAVCSGYSHVQDSRPRSRCTCLTA